MDIDNKKIIVEFSKFAEKFLNIPHNYQLVLCFDRTDENLKTHAYYNPDKNYIKVYAKGRCIADVLRSIGHEMVHHKQNLDHLLDQPIQDVGGDIENEANSLTGQMVKRFGYDHPELAIYDKSIL